MKRLVRATVVAALLVGCGNYSNEDLDFQLALPTDGELEAKLPQALALPNSAELYLQTRAVVRLFNGVAATLVGLVDHVRRYPPTSRRGAERIWGPFADDKAPGWQARVVMSRLDDEPADDAFRVAYQFQLRRAGQDDAAFFDLLGGTTTAWGSARRGEGQIHLDTQAARDAGYPVDDPNDPHDLNALLRLHLVYRTTEYPIQVSLRLENLPNAAQADDAREAAYDYAENADGSGALGFTWKVDPSQALDNVTELQIASRWLGSGAGRADARVPVGPASVVVATDCWGIDTVATYTRRPEARSGAPETCVLDELAAP